MDGFSDRGALNLMEIMAKVPESLLKPSSNPDEINLSIAENWVIRYEVLDILKSSLENSLRAQVRWSRASLSLGPLTSQHLDWPTGFWGDPGLLEILARVFNTYFHPHITVESRHVVVAPGAAACLDAILYNICNPGDGVLVPCPYWSRVKFQDLWKITADKLTQMVTMPSFSPILRSSRSRLHCLILTHPLVQV